MEGVREKNEWVTHVHYALGSLGIFFRGHDPGGSGHNFLAILIGADRFEFYPVFLGNDFNDFYFAVMVSPILTGARNLTSWVR